MALDGFLQYLYDIAKEAKLNGLTMGNSLMIVGATFGSMGIYALSRVMRSDIEQVNPEIEYITRWIKERFKISVD
jgi:hypothetical protein